MGRNGNLENVAKRFVSVFLQTVPASCTMFGGGAWIEDGGCEEKNVDLPGSQDLSERGLGVEERADEAISTSSRVRGTLELGDVCQSACDSFSDVGENRVYFASKILTPCRMH